jgi:hypothetical protein
MPTALTACNCFAVGAQFETVAADQLLPEDVLVATVNPDNAAAGFTLATIQRIEVVQGPGLYKPAIEKAWMLVDGVPTPM